MAKLDKGFETYSYMKYKLILYNGLYRLCPIEDECKFCSSALTDAIKYTSNGKLLTTGTERLIEGRQLLCYCVSTYIF